MASTTSNTDLVPREALDELKALDAQLKTTIDNMQALLKPVKEINNALSKSATNYKALTDAINKLNAVEEDYKKNATEHKRLKTEIEKLHVRLAQAQSAEAKEVAVLKEQIRQQNLEIKNSAREMLSASGSIDQLRARINVLTLQYNAMSEAVRNSDVGQNMQKQIKEMNDQVSVLEQGVGNYRRNVGNYASGFTPLQFQVQQLARELPSLTVSAQQFFLAISNNLPMLVDELGRAKAANAALKKSGESGVPVWKQLLGAVKSWQTLLVVGITVITAYGKEIGAFFKELFTGAKAFDIAAAAKKNYNQAMLDGYIDSQKAITQLKLLYEATQNSTLSIGERRKAAQKMQELYPSYLNSLSVENILAGNAKKQYEELSLAILQTAKARAAENNMIKNNEKILEIQGKKEYAQIKSYEKLIENNNAQLAELASKGIKDGPIVRGIKAWNSTYRAEIKKLKKSFGDEIGDPDGYIEALTIANERLSKEALKLYTNRNPVENKEDFEEWKRIMEQRAETIKQLAQSQLEARRELAVSMMEASAEENKAIVEDENASFGDRMSALIAFTEQKKQVVQQSAQNQIDALIEEKAKELGLDASNAEARAKIEKELADEINLIRWKASEEAKKIDQEQVDTAIELEKQRVDGIINEITREAAERRRKMSLDESNELKQLSNNYAAGLLTTEQYEQAKEDVTRRYTKKRFDAEWAMLSQQLEVMLKAEGASQDEILAIRKKMEDAKVAYAIKANNDIIKNNDKTGRKLSEVPRKLKDLTKENIAQILQAWSDAFSSVMDLMSASLEGELNALDEEAEANEKWAEEETERIDRLEEAGAISKEQADARKAAVDDQAAAREAEIEQKKKDIQQRQARYDKASSAMKIMVSTAVAIMSAWELGPILGPILGALAAATGAAQLATVLATPIPEYAHGTQDHPGGLAVVGDGGRPEMIVTPGGSVYKTPATDTLLDLPEHSVVLPDFSQAINALAFEKLPEIPVRQTDSAIKLSEMEGLFKTTNKQIGAFMDSFNRYKANRRYDSMFNRKKTTKIS